MPPMAYRFLPCPPGRSGPKTFSRCSTRQGLVRQRFLPPSMPARSPSFSPRLILSACSALVLMSTTARYVVGDDYPAGASPEMVDSIVEIVESRWGTTEFVDLINPSMAENPEFATFVAKMLRASATPRTAAALYNYILRTLDVRAALPMVQAPTLVLHAIDDPIVPIEHAQFLADHIVDARLITLPGTGPGISPANYSLADEVAEFVTGERPRIQVERILTTVLFTDIVGSTQHAARVGDRRWRSLLDSHDRFVREQLARFDGREVKTTGDGFLAAFDGPGRAIRCAEAITKGTETLGIPVRTGLHTGECEVRGDDLGGLAVHIAARVGALAAPGEVLVSRTVADLVAGSGIEFQDRGAHELKGVPSTWNLAGSGIEFLDRGAHELKGVPSTWNLFAVQR